MKPPLMGLEGYVFGLAGMSGPIFVSRKS